MQRKPIYWVLLALTVTITLLAVLTMVPRAASAESLIGYHALCSFTPVSTVILVLLAAAVCFVRRRVGYYR